MSPITFFSVGVVVELALRSVCLVRQTPRKLVNLVFNQVTQTTAVSQPVGGFFHQEVDVRFKRLNVISDTDATSKMSFSFNYSLDFL